MLFNGYHIAISFAKQQFQCRSVEILEEDGVETGINFEFASTLSTSTVFCPYCGSGVHVCDNFTTELRDIPLYIGLPQTATVKYHRYRCQNCRKSFSEETTALRHPGTRITERAANWIKGFLQHKMTVSDVASITGIHWETIRRIQTEVITEKLNERKRYLHSIGYKPQFLAVDEFAIHKGHTYATCVLDLEEGDVIWVGNGRTIADFSLFFQEIDRDYLSEVKAVAMDMNASYHSVITKELPEAEIVYDRYHMQAQYGRDVLGSVRLQEAREHAAHAKELKASLADESDHGKKMELSSLVKTEQQQYRQLKGLRWTLLKNSGNLAEKENDALEQILTAHSDLAVCYAMKEEMCALFELRDVEAAEAGWIRWFDAAEKSGIPALQKFAVLKRKRLPGLVAHALYPISTGKLEGLNNKIKVAKRNGYGYRNDTYFFSLIQFLSLPSSRGQSPNLPR